MLFGKMDEKPGRSPEEGRDLAVFPLAVPSIAGPGAMMAVIVLTDNDVYTVPERIETGTFKISFFLHFALQQFPTGKKGSGSDITALNDGDMVTMWLLLGAVKAFATANPSDGGLKREEIATFTSLSYSATRQVLPPVALSRL